MSCPSLLVSDREQGRFPNGIYHIILNCFRFPDFSRAVYAIAEAIQFVHIATPRASHWPKMQLNTSRPQAAAKLGKTQNALWMTTSWKMSALVFSPRL